MSADKKLLRDIYVKERANLTYDEAKEKSAQIVKKLVNTQEYKKSKLVMTYISFGNEVDTHNMISGSLMLGKRVCVPLVSKINGDKNLQACEIYGMERELVPGAFGILEPDPQKAIILDPLEIDLVIVPGVAFDRSKQRIGFGAGYYDRFLPRLKADCIKIGLAFEIQLLEKIPAEQHDVPLDFIITECGII